MGACAISLFLILFPLGGEFQFQDRYDDLAVHQCGANRIESVWIQEHILYIENESERFLIPLPPVREKEEMWILFDLQRGRVNFWEWGNVYVRKGPKQPI